MQKYICLISVYSNSTVFCPFRFAILCTSSCVPSFCTYWSANIYLIFFSVKQLVTWYKYLQAFDTVWLVIVFCSGDQIPSPRLNIYCLQRLEIFPFQCITLLKLVQCVCTCSITCGISLYVLDIFDLWDELSRFRHVWTVECFRWKQVNQTGLTITLINTDKKCQNFKNTCERLESL